MSELVGRTGKAIAEARECNGRIRAVRSSRRWIARARESLLSFATERLRYDRDAFMQRRHCPREGARNIAPSFKLEQTVVRTRRGAV